MTTRHILALLVLMLAAFGLLSWCAVASRAGAAVSTVLWIGGSGVVLALIAAVVAVRWRVRQQSYSIDEVDAHLTAKIEARRDELMANRSEP